MYKQIIILRKKYDNGHEISFGKACAMVAHGSLAYFTTMIRNNNFQMSVPQDYMTNFTIDKDLYEQWIEGAFTKCVLEAKNKNQLLKAKTMAEEMGMVEGEDFFLIKDNCNTELEPEEIDEDGVGRTLTCIGFKPMDAKIIDKIGKKFQLYK